MKEKLYVIVRGYDCKTGLFVVSNLLFMNGIYLDMDKRFGPVIRNICDTHYSAKRANEFQPAFYVK